MAGQRDHALLAGGVESRFPRPRIDLPVSVRTALANGAVLLLFPRPGVGTAPNDVACSGGGRSGSGRGMALEGLPAGSLEAWTSLPRYAIRVDKLAGATGKGPVPRPAFPEGGSK